MVASKSERNRVLTLIEEGQVSAAQAAQLLDTLEAEVVRPAPRGGERLLRIRMTNSSTKASSVHLHATFPVRLLVLGLQLGVRLFPQLEHQLVYEIIQNIDEGMTGRLLDLQDIERGERLEIFVD